MLSEMTSRLAIALSPANRQAVVQISRWRSGSDHDKSEVDRKATVTTLGERWAKRICGHYRCVLRFDRLR